MPTYSQPPAVSACSLLAPPMPVARPRLPKASLIMPYIQEIDANRYYANHGQLWLRLQSGLGRLWGVQEDSVALVANATLGITLALMASGARPGSRCLLPSWTFVASAAAVRLAGLVPHFVDVLAETWALDPDAIEGRSDLADVGAILVVCPFGSPIDSKRWDAVSAATKIPVIIDAAAAFDTIREEGPMAIGDAPIVVSLHATKVFGIGEGGAVICRDAQWRERFRRLTNFGYYGTREALLPGINAKISEYAAAVGVAALAEWPHARARWATASDIYQRLLTSAVEIDLAPNFGQDWVTSTLSVIYPFDSATAADLLRAEGISTLRWWGAGCHAQPAYSDCPRDPLPVTDDLGLRVIGLPLWQDLTRTQIAAVVQAVRRTTELGAAVKRLRDMVPKRSDEKNNRLTKVA